MTSMLPTYKNGYLFKANFKKYKHLQNVPFTGLAALLLLGFLTGNLFGTILDKIRTLFYWDIIIIFFLVIFFEFVSYAAYHKQKPNVFFLGTYKTGHQVATSADKPIYTNFFFKLGFGDINHFIQDVVRTAQFWKFANFFKIGIMIGFFVDAFKVGS
uniref:hypothetical chloroplast RF20 n=1 Tax=Kalinella pachyderma TaxID=2704665 RepID=UPI00241178B0|nr:hypothetical chloroplast RF20 [Kalinella pachyderma]WDY12873.1 hypothetical chloroplast RF20 [Kalinella pachyderma]